MARKTKHEKHVSNPFTRDGVFDLAPLGVAVAAAFGGVSFDATAAPQGGAVVAGQARIQQTTPNRIDVIQSSNRSVINWQSFSIGGSEHVNFQQPSASAATLNRVVGADPSQIMGRLTANGQVFLINPNGVLFGQGAKIDVGSLITSAANISNDNFMAGRLKFDEVSNPNGTIVNRGEITVAKGGLVALVAPGVENAGVIRAQLGKVVLASGNAFSLDLYGDKLIRLMVDERALDQLTDVEGRTLRSLVTNSGAIQADGGQVLLTASAARAVVDSTVNMTGSIQANTFEQRAGEIVLHAQAGSTQVSGSMVAAGNGAGDKGGVVQVLGESAHIAGTTQINTSGQAGGGTVLIGGDWQGSGTTQRSGQTTVEPGVTIRADAITQGDGGKVVVWADGHTAYAGEISARGGAQGGNGGKVEVSGKGTLDYTGLVDASAPNGQAGSLLLDPTDWTIDAATANAFSGQLRNGTSITIQADNAIDVNQAIDGRGGVAGASLALNAGNQIRLNNDLLTNNGAISLTAGGGGVQMGGGSLATGNNGALVYAGNQPITINSAGSVSAQHLITSGAINITTTGANADVALNRDLYGLSGTPIGSLTVNAGGAIQTLGLNGTGAAMLTAGRNINIAPSASNTFAAGSISAAASAQLTVQGNVLSKNSGAITLAGTRVSNPSGEIHSDGGKLEINAGSGGVAIAKSGGLFSGSGDTVIDSGGNVEINRIALSGNLDVTSRNGYVWIDSELGGVISGTAHEEFVGRVTIRASGVRSDVSTQRTYCERGAQFASNANSCGAAITVQVPVGVRVRSINSRGGVDISSTSGDILLDGTISSNESISSSGVRPGSISLNAPRVTARHSIYALGGNVEIGGTLYLEPWGDDILFQRHALGSLPPGTSPGPDGGTLVRTNSYPNTLGQGEAPGSSVISAPLRTSDMGGMNASDSLINQITIRATKGLSVDSGRIVLTTGIVKENARADQQLAQYFNSTNNVDFSNGAFHREGLVPAHFNATGLYLQADRSISFLSSSPSGFAFLRSGRQDTYPTRHNEFGTLMVSVGPATPGEPIPMIVLSEGVPQLTGKAYYWSIEGVDRYHVGSVSLPSYLPQGFLEGIPQGPSLGTANYPPPSPTRVGSIHKLSEIDVGRGPSLGAGLSLSAAFPAIDVGSEVAAVSRESLAPRETRNDEVNRGPSQATDSGSDDLNRGPIQAADTGRGSGGSRITDVFRGRWHVTDRLAGDMSNADEGYFGLSLFDYLRRPRR